MSGNATVIHKTKYTYGNMFDLPACSPSDGDLISLGMGMHSTSPQERSTLPAGYVFLGQFIDHDLAHDTLSTDFPTGTMRPLDLENAREPFFTLDVLYGDENGPDSKDFSHLYEDKSPLLRLSNTLPASQEMRKLPNDLPRKSHFAGASPDSREFQEAMTVDRRQDENLAIAQTHVAFIKFHNAVAANRFNGKGKFKKIRELVIKHYQEIVLNDFLPRIVDRDILREVRENIAKRKQFFRPNAKRPIMPIEFSVGAFRMGHSIVAEQFDWNRAFRKATIQDLSDFTARGRMQGETIHDAASGKRIPLASIPSDWIIDWTRFYDFGDNSTKLTNFAARMDTSMIDRFRTLMPDENFQFNTYKSSLAVRNLFRGRKLGLPSGQAVAKELCGRSAAVRKKSIGLFGGSGIIGKQSITDKWGDAALKDRLGDETPLWYYILKEAELAPSDEKGAERLGPVGSWIMCEAMLGLMKVSPISILNDPHWRPSLFRGPKKPTYSMPDLLSYAGDLNPLG